jgi:nucleoside-diphosphate-sugar epimerase
VRVAITGATGFIGSRLALRRLAFGDCVRALGRENNPAEAANARELAAAGAQLRSTPVSDRTGLVAAFRGVDVVFHLAAAQHESAMPESYFREVNVEGTRNVMEAACAAGVQRIVHGSTIGVYEALPGMTVNEHTPLVPQNVYGVTKLAAEKVVRCEGKRIPWVIARISESYGPGDRRLLKLFRGAARGLLVQIGGGANLHHMVYIDDLLDGLDAAARVPEAEGRSYVLAGPEPVPTRMLLDAVAGALGGRSVRLKVPLAPLLALAVVLEHTLAPLRIQPPLHRRRLDFFRKSFAFAQNEAQRDLCYSPKVDLVSGVERTLAWYRAQRLL